MKRSLISIFTGLLVAMLSAFALTDVGFSAMTTKITQDPFKMIILGMVLMGLGTFLKRRTIR